MTRAEAVKAEYEIALKVAQLEDKVIRLKQEDPDSKALHTAKDELREWRCVLRLGRPAPDGSHQGFNIVNGQLVAKEAAAT